MPAGHAAVMSRPNITASLSTVVTIDNTGGAAKTDHQVRVDLTASNFTFSATQANGYDLSFTSADGLTPLSHWRQDFDKSGQTATLWVKVPSIPANDHMTIKLLYGGSVGADPASIDNTFLVGQDFRSTTAMADVVGDCFETFPFLGNRNAAGQDPIITFGSTWKVQHVHEQSNIVWTGTEFVFLCTGTTAGADAVGLITASAIDGAWTDYSATARIANAEDPYIVVTTAGDLYTDGSGWHYVFFERKNTAASDTGVARTKNFRTDWEVWNGSAWTTSTSTHAAVLVKGTSGAWDDTFCYSPTVVHDGTQFVCVYEGAADPGGPFATGVARSPDGITWTKEATNPILSLEVPDDIKLIGGTWYLYGHGDAGDQYRYKTTDTPANWTSSSFAAYPGKYAAGGNSVNLAFGFAGAEKWATYEDGIGVDGLRLYQWIGGPKWNAAIVPLGTNSMVFEKIGISATHDSLELTPDYLHNSMSLVLWTDATPLVNDFMIVARRRQVAQNDDQLAGIAIGTGTPIEQSGFIFHACFPDGYLFQLTNPTQFIQIRKYTTAGGSIDTVSTTSATAAEANNFNLHELVYSSTGLLDYRLAGTSRVSRTDTTHLAASKSMALVQGNNTSGDTGAISEYQYVFARHYDGVETTVAVGTIPLPVNTVAPAITGTTREGATLTASNGTWTSPLPLTYTYQWKRDGADIGSATASTYLLVPADQTHSITVAVTASNLAGPTTATSSGVGPITAWSPLALTNLVAWYDFSDAATVTLSGSAITSVTDKSGNGKTIAQATSANQPAIVSAFQNGRDVAQFATNDLLTNASFALGAHTFAMVVKETTGGILIEHGTNSGTADGAMLYGSTNSTVQVRRTTKSGKDAPASTWLTSPAAFATVIHRWDGTHAGHQLWKNGTAVTLTTVSTNNSDAGTSTVTASLNIGARAGATVALSGHIGEILIMSAAATSDERTRIDAYLARWYP